MGIARKYDVEAGFIVLSFALFCNVALGASSQGNHYTTASTRRGLAAADPSGPTIFDVTAHGAVADGTTDNMEAFMQTWNLACKNAGAAKMVIPKGEFLVGPVVFQGPCKGPPPIVIEVQGTVKAITDISEYSSPEWFSFEHIDGLTITGSGTFDGQGATLWKYNDCNVGSLGKYPTDKSVSNIYVKNCTLRNTMYGARIKTWSGKTTGTATTIVYEDIIVDNVKNPIILDQDYGRNNAEPSKWKVSDVHFRNFKGTSVTNVAVTLACSSAMPCEGVELANIDMRYGGSKAKMATVSSSCANAKTTHSGVQNPPPCSGSAPAAPGAEAPAAPDAKAPAAPDAKPPAAPDTKPPEASPS
ncbi:hypothetical protein FEM48_Zijuj09G0019400 [Ziziphus jujuba var. spinosa]|uniref:Exopolygalacturonase-like n=1 Tax=Ziziphus jujuba var. spinosa TaxID=714518 RepID=A0A978UQ88_ZIZJJ|nr:hypothetical protein FEM48_Zijuj09G0019400 [Ziziphus jujuba var. spinosa]